MSIAHAKLSASGSSRWLSCPGSVRACASIESKSRASETNPAAEEGTCAHELADICIRNDASPHDYIGKTLSDAPSVVVDKEMANYVSDYIDYCLRLGGDYFPEERVSFDKYVPDGFGTSDFFTFTTDESGNTTCDIIDLKYGKGIAVHAESNSQAMLYALGVLQEYDHIFDVNTFNLHIYQPRISNISCWTISTDDLICWGETTVKPLAIEALGDNGRMIPGEKQCQFCSYKAHCRSLLEFSYNAVGADFNKVSTGDDFPQVDKLGTDAIGHILQHKSLIESWLKSVEKRAYEELNNGSSIEGFKLVHGRSSRKWIENEHLISTLTDLIGDDVYTKKLITPPAIEKMIGRAKYEELVKPHVQQSNGSPTIAKSSDKRKSIIEDNDVKNDF